jgi:hypothetical protein
MERSSASVGSGIFRCRSGCRPGGRGGSILNGFPSRGGFDEIRLTPSWAGRLVLKSPESAVARYRNGKLRLRSSNAHQRTPIPPQRAALCDLSCNRDTRRSFSRWRGKGAPIGIPVSLHGSILFCRKRARSDPNNDRDDNRPGFHAAKLPPKGLPLGVSRLTRRRAGQNRGIASTTTPAQPGIALIAIFQFMTTSGATSLVPRLRYRPPRGGS